MTVIQGYTQSVLLPQLRSLALSKRQREIVLEDVSRRLESLLFHWSDLAFRRTILTPGNEEASFWEPQTASLETRSLVVVAVRNSLIEDLGASQPYTKALESRNKQLRDDQMPWITGEATKYFEAANLDAVQVQPERDLFGPLSRRFPIAWHAFSLLSGSSDNEIACELPIMDAESMDSSASNWKVQHLNVVASGIDPRLDAHLVDMLRQIKQRELQMFFSPSFKSITRNPEKLLFVIDHVLRHGGTLMTPNYLLSPTYLSRRTPLIRPIHYTSEIETQVANPVGLSERHKELLTALFGNG
jgi:hypothetical protein